MSDNATLSPQIGVIGSVLLAPEQWAGEVLHRTRDTDFSGACATAYRAIKTLFEAGRPIDAVVMREVMGHEYTGWLMEVMELTPTAAHCEAYISLTVQQARLDRARTIAQAIYNTTDATEAEKLTQALASVFAEQHGVEIVNMSDGMAAFYDRQQTPPNVVKFGLRPLDRVLKAEPGDMVVIGGYPSAGKTAFTLQVAQTQAEHKRVGYFSLETHPSKLFDRMITSACALPFDVVKSHMLSDADWTKVAKASSDLTSRTMDVIRASQMTVAQIRAVAVAKRYEVIYIDYLQLIEGEGNRDSGYERVSRISRGLHNLATSTGILVVALSQLSRPDKSGKAEAAPGLHSLRESGQIEQDADAVMLLYKQNPNEIESTRCLKVAKNKEGRSGGVLVLDFDGEKQLFTYSAQGQYAETMRAVKQAAKAAKTQTYEQVGMLDDNGTPLPY